MSWLFQAKGQLVLENLLLSSCLGQALFSRQVLKVRSLLRRVAVVLRLVIIILEFLEFRLILQVQILSDLLLVHSPLRVIILPLLCMQLCFALVRNDIWETG